MSMSITFDSLGYFEKLKNAGVQEAQAKAQVEALQEIIENTLVTKQDFLKFEKTEEKLRQELATKADLHTTKADLRNEIQNAKLELLERMAEQNNRIAENKHDIAEAKHDILRWMVGGFITQTALLVAILAFFK